MRGKNLYYYRLFLLALYTTGCWLTLTAQSGKSLALEAAVHRGHIWRHTPKLTTRTGEKLWGAELGLRVQTYGRHSWQAWQRYPSLGAALTYFQLGEGSHGEAYGLLPHLTVPIVRYGRWQAGFRLGTGLAWVTRPYDFFDNPGQNAIGSHWNNFTQFRLSGEVRVNPHWLLLAGGSLNHFSNGSGALPNFGINLPSTFVAAVWHPRALAKADFLPATESKRARRRFGGQVQAGQARVEYAVFDGPKYPVWIFTATGNIYFNRANRLALGLDYENNVAVAQWAWHVGNFSTEREARRAAQRLALFLGDEFLFGDLGVQLQAGYYLGHTLNRFTLASWYSKLTARYYLPGWGQDTLRPHLGVSLKAHKAVAEYISFNLGVAF